jgi:fructokinase
MSSPRSAITTGYVALDVVCHDGSVRQVAGGTAANVAANLAYLGWRSSLIGRIGDDAPGRRIAHDLDRAGVELLGRIHDTAVETPVVVHRVTPPNHSFAFKCPVCERRSPRFSPPSGDGYESGELLAAAEPPDLVFADRMSSFSVQLLERYAGRSLIMVEPSARGKEGPAARSAELADVLKWSHELTDELHGVMLEPRPGQLQIETLGAEGLRFRVGGEGWRSSAAPSVDPVDTAGAGDWLTAAFLDALPSLRIESLTRARIHAALDQAQAVAALSCLHVGARSLADLPLERMRADADRLRKGDPPPAAVLAPAGRRSRAGGVCTTCLGPTA